MTELKSSISGGLCYHAGMLNLTMTDHKCASINLDVLEDLHIIGWYLMALNVENFPPEGQ